MTGETEEIITHIPYKKVIGINLFILGFITILLVVPFFITKRDVLNIEVYVVNEDAAYFVVDEDAVKDLDFNSIKINDKDFAIHGIKIQGYKSVQYDTISKACIINLSVLTKHAIDENKDFILLKGTIKSKQKTWGETIFKK